MTDKIEKLQAKILDLEQRLKLMEDISSALLDEILWRITHDYLRREKDKNASN